MTDGQPNGQPDRMMLNIVGNYKTPERVRRKRPNTLQIASGIVGSCSEHQGENISWSNKSLEEFFVSCWKQGSKWALYIREQIRCRLSEQNNIDMGATPTYIDSLAAQVSKYWIKRRYYYYCNTDSVCPLVWQPQGIFRRRRRWFNFITKECRIAILVISLVVLHFKSPVFVSVSVPWSVIEAVNNC